MSLDARARRWALPLPRFRGGAAQILALVLVALVFVFWLLLGDQLFSVGALQSMAFQLPELGILSLAMMIALAFGRPQPLHHRDRQSLCARYGLGADDRRRQARKASCGWAGR